MITGVQSAFTYVGARTIAEFHERAEVGVQTPAGYGRARPTERSASELSGHTRDRLCPLSVS
jgi:IMP dehydrogenase